jgi:hypothetical protein
VSGESGIGQLQPGAQYLPVHGSRSTAR